MSRLLSLVVTLGVLLSAGGWILAQSDGQGRPLDLPNGKVGKDEEDEENEPETIVFYGQEYEADAFFWCLDQSCSMGWGSPLPIQVLKQEVNQAINSLSSNAEFGLVSFSDSYSMWNPIPQRANPANKGSAATWMMNLQVLGGTCLGPAGVATVNLSNQCRKRNKSVIIVGDGVPNCPACAQGNTDITNANWQRTQINTLLIGSGSDAVSCFQSLANLNGGQFTQVN